MAERTGPALRTIRYYEKIGPVTPSRTSDRFRRYAEADVERPVPVGEPAVWCRTIGNGRLHTAGGLGLDRELTTREENGGTAVFQHEARPGAPGAAYGPGGGARLWQAEDRAAGAEAPR